MLQYGALVIVCLIVAILYPAIQKLQKITNATLTIQTIVSLRPSMV
jgi:hypothetical protein